MRLSVLFACMVAALCVLGAGWVLSYVIVPPAVEHIPVPRAVVTSLPIEPVPDPPIIEADGTFLEEDEPGFDCRVMTDRRCRWGHVDTNDITNLANPPMPCKSDIQNGA